MQSKRNEVAMRIIEVAFSQMDVVDRVYCLEMLGGVLARTEGMPFVRALASVESPEAPNTQKRGEALVPFLESCLLEDDADKVEDKKGWAERVSAAYKKEKEKPNGK